MSETTARPDPTPRPAKRGPGRPRALPLEEQRRQVLEAARAVSRSTGSTAPPSRPWRVCPARRAPPSTSCSARRTTCSWWWSTTPPTGWWRGCRPASARSEEFGLEAFVRHNFAAVFDLFEQDRDAVMVLLNAEQGVVDRPTSAPAEMRTRVLQEVAEFTRSRWGLLGLDVGASAEIMALIFFRMAEALAIRQTSDPGWDREAFIDLLTAVHARRDQPPVGARPGRADRRRPADRRRRLRRARRPGDADDPSDAPDAGEPRDRRRAGRRGGRRRGPARRARGATSATWATTRSWWPPTRAWCTRSPWGCRSAPSSATWTRSTRRPWPQPRPRGRRSTATRRPRTRPTSSSPSTVALAAGPSRLVVVTGTGDRVDHALGGGAGGVGARPPARPHRGVDRPRAPLGRAGRRRGPAARPPRRPREPPAAARPGAGGHDGRAAVPARRRGPGRGLVAGREQPVGGRRRHGAGAGGHAGRGGARAAGPAA